MPVRHPRENPGFGSDRRAEGVHLGEIVPSCFLRSEACALAGQCLYLSKFPVINMV